jgi:hypothetical protein
MKKSLKIILLLTGVGVLAAVGLVARPRTQAVQAPSAGPMSSETKMADRVEVVHFHGVAQCWSCKTVGDFALKTVKERFPDEYADGTISFKDVDGSKPENQAIVQKYQATASSLFLNAVTDGHDRIEEDAAVWRLVHNEDKFVEYLEGRIRKFLGR